MSEAVHGSRCPACGRDNACGMNSAGVCWCASEFPPSMPVAADPAAACYCRDCLRERIGAPPSKQRES
ncbi:MAG: cysteine-rich CWC family protein [Burkholderiales bacterium]|nr:cysteine-rich CWC family protein [Burkholderiales bacterium]